MDIPSVKTGQQYIFLWALTNFLSLSRALHMIVTQIVPPHLPPPWTGLGGLLWENGETQTS